MSTTISMLGCGRTGVQTSIMLLERFVGKVAVYDEDADYAKGMVLDFMQASSVQNYHGHAHAVGSVQELAQSSVLIVGEYRDETTPSVDTIQNLMKDIPVCVYACRDFSQLTQFAHNKIFGVHGMVDAAILKTQLAGELNIDSKDIEVMVHGGVGKEMQSTPNMARAGGIPVNEVAEGAYERAFEKARKAYDAFEGGPWSTYYTFASAATEAALLVVSGQGAIIPVTTGAGTRAARVDENGYKEFAL